MNRRIFLRKTAILGSTTLLGNPNDLIRPKPKYKMGYQLFSIRDDMQKDPISTLKALKSMGYEDFELYGFDVENDVLYGHKSSDFKKIIDDLELSITSGHYGFAPFLEKSDDELRRFVDYCITGAKVLDSKYITWPWIAPEQRTMDNFKLMSSKLNIIGEQVYAAGLGFAYHNHGFEFDDHNGETGFDIIMNETDPNLVKLQMDMYWVMHSSKFTPADLIKKQPGRYVMWHLKDMDKKTRDYSEMGNGAIDYLKLLPDPIESGLEFYYVEQGGNFKDSAIQSAATSAEYVKKNLQKFL